MLSHLGDLSQARKATGHFPLLSRPLSRSCHRSSRFQSSKHNFPTHEQKWKILEKPFRAPIQRERASTKRKVALKYVPPCPLLSQKQTVNCFKNTHFYTSRVAYTGSGYYGSQKLAENLPSTFLSFIGPFHWHSTICWANGCFLCNSSDLTKFVPICGGKNTQLQQPLKELLNRRSMIQERFWTQILVIWRR